MKQAPVVQNEGLSFPREQRNPRRAGWLLLHAIILYHLLGLVVAPASVPPSSQLMQESWRCFRHYLQFLNLNHGYHYFAPEPGPSTLIAYNIEFADGHVETGRIPNKDIQPRLMYHRHFMLTEFLPRAQSMREEFRDRLLQAYALELGNRPGAKSVSLSRLTHNLLPMEKVQAGALISDPETYSEEPLGVYAIPDRPPTSL